MPADNTARPSGGDEDARADASAQLDLERDALGVEILPPAKNGGLPARISIETLGYVSDNVDVKNARLPVNYQAAVHALRQCERVDECKEWVNKMEAIAAYARMAEDEDLLKRAIRIKGRAVRRSGELLRQFKSPGGRPEKTPGFEAPSSSQKEVGRRAGMSEDQVKDAVRVSNIPSVDFEQLIESDDPPTVTELAKIGTSSRPQPPKPPGFAEATQFIGEVRDLSDRCSRNSPATILSGLADDGLPQVLPHLDSLRRWINDFHDLLGDNGLCPVDATPAERAGP